jgi:hypothetical protein
MSMRATKWRSGYIRIQYVSARGVHIVVAQGDDNLRANFDPPSAFESNSILLSDDNLPSSSDNGRKGGVVALSPAAVV